MTLKSLVEYIVIQVYLDICFMPHCHCYQKHTPSTLMPRHFKPVSAYTFLKIHILRHLYTFFLISLEKSSCILFEQLLMSTPVGRKTKEHGVTPRIFKQRRCPFPEHCAAKTERSIWDLWLRSVFYVAYNYRATQVGHYSVECFMFEVFSCSNFTLKCLLKQEKSTSRYWHYPY